MFFSCYTFELQISKAFRKSDKLVGKQKCHRDITYLTGPLPVVIIRAYTCNQAANLLGVNSPALSAAGYRVGSTNRTNSILKQDTHL